VTIVGRSAPGSAVPTPSAVVAVSSVAARPAAGRRLLSYAIEGLRRSWMPDVERYSYRFRFDLPESENESIPERDAFYTLNVLLGLSQVPTADREYEYLDIRSTYQGCCDALRSPTARTYMLGMALWAGAKLNIEPPGHSLDKLRAISTDPRAMGRSTAQDIGMLLSGVTALKRRAAAETLATHLRRHYYHPSSHVFHNQGVGYRRQFSSFASQVYPILSLYQFGEAYGRDWAIDFANKAATRMIGLQGRRGEWGWFYYVPRGRVVDYYEVYSVHQHGMAPAFLHHAVAHGVAGAREALVRGFQWLFGDNEMGVSMLRPSERMFYRSQARDGELDGTLARAGRSIVNAALGRSDTVENHRRLVLRRECRSYELGWILWSFGGRNDYPELTERAEFAV
jgi:hypothetical protein